VSASAARRVPRGAGREALCRALVHVVARDGLEGVTFRSVAREAGVTHGLASYHFGTREAMIHEGLAWAAQHAIDDSRIAHDAESLDDFAADLPALIRDRPEEAIFQFRLAIEALRRPELLDDVRVSYDEYVEAVGQTLERFGLGRDPALARVVFAALDGLNLQQLMYGDAARAEQALAALRRLLVAYRPE
jgi:AcrR family transcriptional regulator